MKSISFTVDLTFESKIHDEKDIIEIAENIARAILTESTNGIGIAPLESETYLQIVRVTPQYIDHCVIQPVSY
jgi:hypothetical protein